MCDGCLPACWSGCWVCVSLAVANVHLLAGLGIGKVCIGPSAPMAAPVESVPVAPCAVAAPGDARVASTVRGLLGVGAPKILVMAVVMLTCCSTVGQLEDLDAVELFAGHAAASDNMRTMGMAVASAGHTVVFYCRCLVLVVVSVCCPHNHYGV